MCQGENVPGLAVRYCLAIDVGMIGDCVCLADLARVLLWFIAGSHNADRFAAGTKDRAEYVAFARLSFWRASQVR